MNLKHELEVIWLTSDDKKFIDKELALIHEDELTRKINKEVKKDMELYNKIIKLLNDNDWGLYFKGDPFVSLPVQQGENVFKVNTVTLEELSRVLESDNHKGDKWIRLESEDKTLNPK